MIRHFSRALTAALALLAAFAFTPSGNAREARWVLLGEHTVGFDLDRNTIRLSRDDGWFKALRLDAERADVYVFKIGLIYLNGYREEIPVNRMLRAGERSPAIELGNERSFIREIELTYRSRPNYRGGNALVQIYGDQSRDNRERTASRYRDDEFKAMADDEINLRDDRAVLRPRRGERVGAIRLLARENAVFVRRVEIVFRNGERQVEQLQQALQENRPSRAIDLAGDRRSISEVVVVMRPQPSRGRARLILAGREDGGAAAPVDPPRSNRVGRPPRVDSNGVPVGMVLFGTEQVGRRGDRDVIAVGPDKGQFDEIAFRVLDGDVELNRVTIVYANGERDAIDIGQVIRANSVTSKLKLDGNRFVREIELDYRKADRGRGRASVELYGDYSDAWKRRDRDRDRGGSAGAGRGWVLLGRQKAEMLSKDADVFEVGRDKGRFRAISLIARRNTVQIRAIRIIYANGSSEDVELTGELADGKLRVDEASDPIDLKGRERSIDRIEIVHRSKLSLKGAGVIELWGLASEARFGGDGDSRDGLKRELGKALRNLLKN